jgi:hypothetical protein
MCHHCAPQHVTVHKPDVHPLAPEAQTSRHRQWECVKLYRSEILKIPCLTSSGESQPHFALGKSGPGHIVEATYYTKLVASAVLQKPTVTGMVNEFPVFCDTCGVVAVSTTACGRTLYGSYSHTTFLKKSVTLLSETSPLCYNQDE